jgi:AraC-like DNA-binding protein
MRPADLAPTVFSTAGLPAARRVELWETHNATALIGLDVDATEPLEATELNVQLPQVQLARVAGTPHAVRRTAAVIERSPADAIAVYLTLRGDASFSYPDGTRVLRPGNILVWETDRPFGREFARGLEELVVKVPRAALAGRCEVPRLREPVIATLGAGGGNGQHARALARMTGRATRASRPLPASAGTVLDLVAVLAAGRAAAPATAHRAAARCYVEEHLTDPKLGADQVARAIGISERQLSRVFAAAGTSVPRHILSRRLRLAYSLLSGGSGGDRTVADIAAQCGFTSVTYFSHAFRAHFGQRASDIRREAQARPA